MKNKYTKKNNRNREVSNRKIQETSIEEDNLLERILAEEGAFNTSNDDFNIDIIGASSEEQGTVADDAADKVDDIVDMDDDFDEDMANRLSLYESIDVDEEDEEDEIKEFISRDVVAESRKRVNQPGRRKFEEKEKPKREKQPKKKKEKAKDKSRTKVAAADGSEKKSVIDNLKEAYGKYTMHFLYGALGMLAVVLLITIIVLPKDDNKDNKDSSTGYTNVADDKTGTNKDTGKTDGGDDSTEQSSTEKQVSVADLKPEGDQTEIHKLIVGFIDAERVQCDIEKVKSYLEVSDGYGEEQLEQYKTLKRYIEEYQDIKCYKFDYLTDGMYYVFASYNMKIANIDTLAVGANAFVVRYNEEQGKYYIVTAYTREELAYKVIVENSAEVKALQEDVLTRQNEALAKDDVLKEFIEIMKGASQNKEESTENTENKENKENTES